MVAARVYDGYLNHLQSRAKGVNHIDRFYLFQDEDLAEMEAALADSAESEAFYTALMDLYRSWRSEIGEEKWQEVVKHNEWLNGANRNWLLDDL